MHCIPRARSLTKTAIAVLVLCFLCFSTLTKAFQPSLRTILASTNSMRRVSKVSTRKLSCDIESPTTALYCQSEVAVASTPATTPTATDGPGEVFKFESNVARVMDIIINSLYSNKDVFIRELISNAADACDKKRCIAEKEGKSTSNLKVRVYINKTENTLTIEDSGIGMNKAELIQNLGKIAESGTKKFTEALSNKKDGANLIGQFGVGFYSGFLVADKLSVTTKGSEGKQHRWEAQASQLDKYSIVEDDSNPIEGSGTRITLHIKEEMDQYLDVNSMQSLIEKYSEFVAFPIELQKNVTKVEEIPDLSAASVDGVYPNKTVNSKVLEWYVVNNKKPLWLRNPSECNSTDYSEFYRQAFHLYDDPMLHAHFTVEGNTDFKALIFIPTDVPYELSRDMFAPQARSLKLYVKRVFINDKFEELIPRWLLFVRGVIDSDDLPLNVGREILQQSKKLRIIKQRVAKKTIDMLNDLSLSDETKFLKFWKNFGKYLKVGVIEDEQNRDDVVPLLRFPTTYVNESDSSKQQMTSLPDYVKRMQSNQKYIYYVVADSVSQAIKSPYLESMKRKGYEVLVMPEAIDEMAIQSVEKFAGFEIRDVGRADERDMSEDEKHSKETTSKTSESFREWVKSILGDKIAKVEVSTKLVDFPATIVQGQYGMSPNMQKYLKNAAVNMDNKEQILSASKSATLELNMEHAVIKHLQDRFSNSNFDSNTVEFVNLLFQTASLASGYDIENSSEYAHLVVKMMSLLADRGQ